MSIPMATDPIRAKEIFLQAIERGGRAEREAFLRDVCGDDVALRQHVEILIEADEQAGSFLERGVLSSEATIDQAHTERPGTQIGPYKLLQQIGEGGFGVVYMAEQTEPVRRKVALKVIKPGMDTRQVIARFEAERQALAVMDHPNIAKVLDAGTTGGSTKSEVLNTKQIRNQNHEIQNAAGSDVSGIPASNLEFVSNFGFRASDLAAVGRPFFVMELVRGISITQYCDENNLPIRERLQLFTSVCQAIQHAHTKGIIHRDIKPTNVLVTQQDGEPLVKVIDFGVAKAMGQQLTEKTLFTEFAQMIGTPLYMSPEQAAMSNTDIDTRSDIYSLGVLLYELLTGSTPISKDQFKQATFDEIRRIIREDEAQRPSVRIGASDTLPAIAAHRHVEPGRLRMLMRGELDWIVMKCLDKDRNRRYETAASLAADVKRFLNDEPVQACPPSAWYRFGKFAKRNRREVLIAGAAAAVGVAGVAGLAMSRALIASALQSETRAKEDLRVALYFQRITVAHREISSDNLAATLQELQQCPEDLHGWEWHYLMRLCRAEPLVIRDTIEIHGVAFSPDGKLLASAGGDGTVKIWNSRTGKWIHTIPAHSDSVVSVAFHPEGKHLATRGTGADPRVKVWDLTSGKELFNEPCDAVRKYGTAYTIAFSADGQLLAAGTDGVVKVWDWKNRQRLSSLPRDSFGAVPVAFSRDGRLATGTKREGVKLWDPETGTLLCTAKDHIGPLSAVAFSADGKWVASASYDRTVKLSNSTTGELLHTLAHPGNQVECVAISRDGRRLASGGEDKTVRVWDTTTGREILVLRGHTDRCGCVAFSPDGHRLVSASFDGTIRIWDGTPLRGDEPRQEILTFAKHTNEIQSVAISPDGRQIVSSGRDKLVKVWDAPTGRVSAKFNGHVDPSGNPVVAFCLAWHPHGPLIASGGLDGVWVWDARTGTGDFSLAAAGGNDALLYSAVAFSPDGRYLATGRTDGAVQVWDGKTGQPVGAGQPDGLLGTHKREIVGVVFSKGGEHLASASRDGIVKFWDATRLNKKQVPRPPLRARVPGPSVNVAFSPDGRRLATGAENNTVRIWDVQTGEPLQTLTGHNGEVYTLAFSPDDDGRWIASGGEDSAVKIWDSHTGKLVRNFRGHMGLVSSLAFSPDGKRLVSGSRDKTVKVWDMTQLPER